jgi:hypothetical protein
MASIKATREECLRIMKEITNKAREEGCLLETRDNVFTPDELDARNRQGEFIWANWSNWDLITPGDYLARHTRQIEEALQKHGRAYELVVVFQQEQQRWRDEQGKK